MQETLLDDLLDWIARHHFGKYRGVVKGTEDPAKRGRIEVEVPAVLGDRKVWAMPCVPYAGDGVGMYFIPPEGAGVWVEFEGGDPSFPIWSGCFWADEQVPGDADPNIKLLKTAIAELKVDDSSKDVVFERADGAKVTANDGRLAEAGDSSLDLAGSDATLSQGSASVKVGSGAVDLNSGALKVQ